MVLMVGYHLRGDLCMKEHIMDNDALVKLKEFTRLQREQDQYNLNVINL